VSGGDGNEGVVKLLEEANGDQEGIIGKLRREAFGLLGGFCVIRWCEEKTGFWSFCVEFGGQQTGP
jgi:hypothetical protein